MKSYFSNIGYRYKRLQNKITLLHIYGLLNEEDQETSKRSLVLSMGFDGMSIYFLTKRQRDQRRERGK